MLRGAGALSAVHRSVWSNGIPSTSTTPSTTVRPSLGLPAAMMTGRPVAAAARTVASMGPRSSESILMIVCLPSAIERAWATASSASATQSRRVCRSSTVTGRLGTPACRSTSTPGPRPMNPAAASAAPDRSSASTSTCRWSPPIDPVLVTSASSNYCVLCATILAELRVVRTFLQRRPRALHQRLAGDAAGVRAQQKCHAPRDLLRFDQPAKRGDLWRGGGAGRVGEHRRRGRSWSYNVHGDRPLEQLKGPRPGHRQLGSLGCGVLTLTRRTGHGPGADQHDPSTVDDVTDQRIDQLLSGPDMYLPHRPAVRKRQLAQSGGSLQARSMHDRIDRPESGYRRSHTGQVAEITVPPGERILVEVGFASGQSDHRPAVVQ